MLTVVNATRQKKVTVPAAGLAVSNRNADNYAADRLRSSSDKDCVNDSDYSISARTLSLEVSSYPQDLHLSYYQREKML